jgi:hypothetical protein
LPHSIARIAAKTVGRVAAHGPDRVYPRRQKDARTGSALLMHVVDDLRAPGVENLFNSEPRFDLREAVPVAVVIVTDVLMV